MAVHMIELKCESALGVSDAEIEQAVGDWLGSHEEVLTNQRLSLRRIERQNSPSRLSGHWRFANSEDRATLLDGLETALGSATEWHRLRYHICDHDDSTSNRGGCSWDETLTREQGTVPSGLR